jgi:hypothetical protein
MDKPMPVLVCDTSDILYACRFGADEVPNYREMRNLEDCPGRWFGRLIRLNDLQQNS